jgi:PAS domain S-box-containing protein
MGWTFGLRSASPTRRFCRQRQPAACAAARCGGHSPDSTEARADVQASLDAIRSQYNYKSISLIDAQTLMPAFHSGNTPTRSDVECAASAAETERVRWIDLAPQHSSSEYRAGLVRRIKTSGPLSKFVALLEVEPMHLVRPLADARFAALDGQSMLMRVQGSDVVRLAPRRDPTGDALVFFNDIPRDSLERRLATVPSNYAHGVSFNGHEALAMSQPLSLKGWYLVGALDESEVFAELREYTQLAVAVYVVLVVAVAAGLLLWVRAERHSQRCREAGMVDFYDQILRHGDALFVLNDWRGKVVDASFSTVRAFGKAREELLGMDVMSLAPEHERAGILAMVKDMAVGETREFVGERLRSDGSTFFVEGSVGLLEIQGRSLAHAAEPHQTLGAGVGARLLPDVLVVLRDALVQVADFAEQIAHHGVGPAGQVLQALAGTPAYGGRLERQHDAELRQQAADAVERGGALFDESLACTVQHQLGPLRQVLDRHEAHVWALHRLADRGGIGRIVLSQLPFAAMRLVRDGEVPFIR